MPMYVAYHNGPWSNMSWRMQGCPGSDTTYQTCWPQSWWCSACWSSAHCTHAFAYLPRSLTPSWAARDSTPNESQQPLDQPLCSWGNKWISGAVAPRVAAPLLQLMHFIIPWCVHVQKWQKMVSIILDDCRYIYIYIHIDIYKYACIQYMYG